MEEDREDRRVVQGRPSSVLPPGFAEQNFQHETQAVCTSGDGAWPRVQRLGFPGSEPLGRVAAGHDAVPKSFMHLPTADSRCQEKRSQPQSTPRPNTEWAAVHRSVSDLVALLRL